MVLSSSVVNVTQTDVSVDRSAVAKTAPSLHLDRGASVGRYVILDVVGEGGMGIVYAAYDPELDRKLALKLLRTASSERRAERRRLRLIREAQAMARLSHANVITVHDVGTIDDQVFVAMEFIEGCSLAEWIRMDHDWRRVVDVFVQAGEGLAAAHAAGLVHRDFKPDNVMLTAEHRAVVTDFGLARAAGRGGSESRDVEGVAGPSPTPSRGSLSTTVTAAGAIMGTPAYMSAEQHEGRAVDARSDQFAFAVALYEALYGVRPFPGDDVASLAYNVGAGNIRPAPSRSPVPSWIRQVLLQALSVEPSERYPSMVELLEALRRDRPGARRWPWVTTALFGATGAAIAGGVWLDEPADPCAGGEAQLEAVLGDEARGRVRTAFAESPSPFAAEGWPAVDGMLSGYASQWLESYAEVCTLGRENPGAVHASRSTCLERRLDDVEALLTVLGTAEPRALEGALGAVAELPSPQGCRTADASEGPLAPALYGHLSTVAALQRTGLSDKGLVAARELVEKASSTQDDGLQAEARVWLASLQRTAGRLELAEYNYKEALGLALRSAHDAVAADAAVALVELVGADASRTKEAEGWVGLAEALQDRVVASPDERAALLGARAQLLEVSGRGEAARRPLQEAVDLLEDAHGQEDVRVASAWVALGHHALRAQDPDAARPLFERARVVVRGAFGSMHPRTAAILHALGEVSLMEGNLDQAAVDLEQALAVRRLYPDPAPRAETMVMRSFVEMARGDLEAAEDTLVTVSGLSGLPAELRGHVAVELARLALRRGDVASALRGARASRALVTGSGRIEQAQRWGLDAIIADALLHQGDVGDAEHLVRDTVAALEAAGTDAPWRLAEPLTIRGEVLLAKGMPARALGDLERALSLRPALDAYGTARTEFALARALSAVDPASARARELARGASARLDVREPLYAEIQSWLSAR